MALDQNDLKEIRSTIKDELKNIRSIIKEEFFDGFSRVWEDNIEPVMATKKELKELATQKHVDARFDALEKNLTEHAITPSILRDRTLNEKGDTIATKLETKEVFTEADVSEVKQISPVAVNQ